MRRVRVSKFGGGGVFVGWILSIVGVLILLPVGLIILGAIISTVAAEPSQSADSGAVLFGVGFSLICPAIGGLVLIGLGIMLCDTKIVLRCFSCRATIDAS